MCFDFLYKFGMKHFSFSEEMSGIWSQMYTENTSFSYYISRKVEFSRPIFENNSNIKFH